MNNSPQHLTFNQLVDFVESRLPPEKVADVEAHIAACLRCSREIDRLKKLIELMRTDAPEDAPPSVIARVLDSFRSRILPIFRPAGLRRSVLAVLRFDSLGMAPAFGMRSGIPGTRQLLYSAGAREIDLRIEPRAQEWIVSGQVFGGPTVDAQIELDGGNDTHRTVLNDQSEFTLPGVQAGRYRLILSLRDIDIEVDELKIGI
jgi:anti-sigma factor RsiW